MLPTKMNTIIDQIINPTGVGLNATLPVEVTQRAVQAVFANGGVNQILQHNSTIDVTIELQNSAGVTLPDVGFKVSSSYCHFFP